MTPTNRRPGVKLTRLGLIQPHGDARGHPVMSVRRQRHGHVDGIRDLDGASVFVEELNADDSQSHQVCPACFWATTSRRLKSERRAASRSIQPQTPDSDVGRHLNCCSLGPGGKGSLRSRTEFWPWSRPPTELCSCCLAAAGGTSSGAAPAAGCERLHRRKNSHLTDHVGS